MTTSFNHPAFLSEKEICDKLQVYFEENKIDEYPTFREMKISQCRPDFITFYENNVEIIEVKLTANWSSLRQLAFYQRIIDEHIRTSCFRWGRGFPSVHCSLYAVNFDFEIIDACFAFGISMQKISIKKNKTIEVGDPDCDVFPNVSVDDNFIRLVKMHFGVLDG